MDVKRLSFTQALEGFTRLVAQGEAGFDPVIQDAIQNGKAQKFEYTLELCWKAIKETLKSREGIDESSPKKVVRAFFLAGYLKEADYLRLLQAIDDRNQLSHIYDQAVFN